MLFNFFHLFIYSFYHFLQIQTMQAFKIILTVSTYFLIINLSLAQTDTIPTIPAEVPQELEDSEPEAFVEKTEAGESVYRIVDEMPRFPGCENSDKPTALKNACAKDKLVNFIAGELKYPKEAADEGLEGMVLVSFVVNENGDITMPEVKRDIGGKCGEEALRVVSLMPKWIPGVQGGEAVKVRFNLPINFRLQSKNKAEPIDETTQYKLIWGNAQAEGVPKSELARLSDEKIYVRDLYGKIHPISELELEYTRGLKYKRLDGDDQINSKMAKIIRKAGKRGRIIFSAIIQGKKDFLTVTQEFIIK